LIGDCWCRWRLAIHDLRLLVAAPGVPIADS
jgi:hypothetical protein